MQENEIKGMHTEKAEIKLFQLKDNMTVNIEHPMKCTKNVQVTISLSRSQNVRPVFKNQLYFYIQTIKYRNKNLKTIL